MPANFRVSVSTRIFSFFLAIAILGIVATTLLLNHVVGGYDSLVVPESRHGVEELRYKNARTYRIGKSSASDCCKTYPDPGNIAIVVKTGATAIHDRLPTQVSTSLQCVKEPLIFSDLESNLGDLHVHDVLSNFTSSVAENNEDFDIYRLQKTYLAQGRENDIRRLRELPIATKDWRTEGRNAAWSLDKYKFLHIVERAWLLRPEQDWYLFLEADTYLSWPNLLSWTSVLDPTQRMYLGHPVLMYEHEPRIYFAHGGAGILLSGATVREFAEKQDLAKRWDNRIAKMWFGDFVLADALHEELRLGVSNASLSMSPDDPSAVTFRPEVWCQPLVTIHHMTSRQFDQLWQWEQKNSKSALLYKDLYEVMFPRGTSFMRKRNWDNGADDKAFALRLPSNATMHAGDRKSTRRSFNTSPHENFRNCQQACEQNPECMSFMWTNMVPRVQSGARTVEKHCHLSRAFRHGNARRPETSTKEDIKRKIWMSGWSHDRIAEWVKTETCHTSTELISWPPYELVPAS